MAIRLSETNIVGMYEKVEYPSPRRSMNGKRNCVDCSRNDYSQSYGMSSRLVVAYTEVGNANTRGLDVVIDLGGKHKL